MHVASKQTHGSGTKRYLLLNNVSEWDGTKMRRRREPRYVFKEAEESSTNIISIRACCLQSHHFFPLSPTPGVKPLFEERAAAVRLVLTGTRVGPGNPKRNKIKRSTSPPVRLMKDISTPTTIPHPRPYFELLFSKPTSHEMRWVPFVCSYALYHEIKIKENEHRHEAWVEALWDATNSVVWVSN